jgi:hypothetical protein
MSLTSNRETTADVRVVSLNGSDPELLPQFVAAAHTHVKNSLYLLSPYLISQSQGSESESEHWRMDREPFLVIQCRDCAEQVCSDLVPLSCLTDVQDTFRQDVG